MRGPGCLSLCVCLVPTCPILADLALKVGSGGLHPTAPIMGNGQQGHSCQVLRVDSGHPRCKSLLRVFCGPGETLTDHWEQRESCVRPPRLMC